MPRKTKKISTAKRGGTKSFTLQDFWSIWCVGCAIGTVALTLKYMLSLPMPQVGECYEHRDSWGIYAKVKDLGYDRGDYTDVEYEVRSVSLYEAKEELTRTAEEFRERYSKIDNCDIVNGLIINSLEFEIEKLKNSRAREQ